MVAHLERSDCRIPMTERQQQPLPGGNYENPPATGDSSPEKRVVMQADRKFKTGAPWGIISLKGRACQINLIGLH